MIIKRTSSISGIAREKDIPVNPDDYMSWKMGLGGITDLMPYLSSEDRDFILAGITKDEWREFIKMGLEQVE
jgi:hypothetical protein